MDILEDKAVGLALLASLFQRDRTPLLTPNPHSIYADQRIGRMLALGSTDFIFTESRIPDYRVEAGEEGAIDVQNEARHELYLQRLAAFGADRKDLERRQLNGFRARARILAKIKGSPKFKDLDQSGVPRLQLVV